MGKFLKVWGKTLVRVILPTLTPHIYIVANVGGRGKGEKVVVAKEEKDSSWRFAEFVGRDCQQRRYLFRSHSPAIESNRFEILVRSERGDESDGEAIDAET